MSKRTVPPQISIDEWHAEIDKLRTRPRRHDFAPEIIEIIRYARTPDHFGRVIPYSDLSTAIEQKFDLKIPATTLESFYNREIKGR